MLHLLPEELVEHTIRLLAETEYWDSLDYMRHERGPFHITKYLSIYQMNGEWRITANIPPWDPLVLPSHSSLVSLSLTCHLFHRIVSSVPRKDVDMIMSEVDSTATSHNLSLAKSALQSHDASLIRYGSQQTHLKF